jgi:hypothetical protein
MRHLLSSLFLMVALLLAAGLPVSAAAPATEVEQIEASFVLPAISSTCGFTVTMTVEGQVIHRSWVAESGDVVREIDSINLSRTVSANGNALSFKDAGADKLTVNPDGSTTIESVGNIGLVTVPGSGPVLGGAGRTVVLLTPVLDAQGNPVLDDDGNPLVTEEVLSDTGLRERDIPAI